MVGDQLRFGAAELQSGNYCHRNWTHFERRSEGDSRYRESNACSGWVQKELTRKLIALLFECHFLISQKAYNVDDNTDLFYNEMREGVSQILIGTCGSHAAPLVLLGGNGKQKRINYIYTI